MDNRPGFRALSVLVLATTAVLSGFSPAAFATGASGWDQLGHGSTTALSALAGKVDALNTSDPGFLFAGGDFLNAGGIANADHLARWNGTAWSAVNGASTLNGAVNAIAYHAGKVFVGGVFTKVGGNTNINYLAEWTGSAWISPCSGTNPITAYVSALQIVNNTLYVGGSFSNASGIAEADYLVGCDLSTGAASATVPKDGDLNSAILALAADSNGTLYAGGNFNNFQGNIGEDHVAYLQGGAWHQMGVAHAVDDRVRSLTAHGTDVYIGTDATNVAGIAQADHVVHWDANSLSYSAMGSNTGGTDGWFNSYAFIYGMTTYNSYVFVSGSFQNPNGVATADEFAYFDGSNWHALGSNGAGNGALNSYVNALAIYNNSVVAGGNFTNAGGDLLIDYLGSHTLLRPDARIGTAPSGPFIGDNVYSPTGTGETKSISIVHGHLGTLFLNVQNDGVLSDVLKISGSGGGHGFTVAYSQGTTSDTTKVVAGSFATATLAPGSNTTMRVTVHAPSTRGGTFSFLIRARSSGSAPLDAVTVIVKST